MTILAIDLGKYNSVACYYDSANQSSRFRTLRTTPAEVRQLLLREPVTLVVLEAGSSSGWIADLCESLNITVAVANTSGEAWKWKNVKRKTDRDDALKLARLAALGHLVPVHIPTQPTREHRWLVKYRKTLVGRITRIQNNLRALFVQHGVKLPVGARAWTAAGLEQIAEERCPLDDCSNDQLWRGQLDMELTELARQREALRAVDRKLDVLATQDERIGLLTSVPGVGRKTAEVIATHLDRPERFANARHVSSYAGLVPRRWQSGQTDHSGRVTKRGSRLLRSALVECAWVMLRYNEWARTLFVRICQGQKNRRKKAIVAIARKLLVRCWAMLRDNRRWQPAAAG